MKRGYKNLLSVLGAVGLIVPFAGCETDAEEAQTENGGTNKTAGAAAPASADTATTTGTTTATSETLKTAAEPAPEASSAPVANTTATNTVPDGAPAILSRIPPTLPSNVELSKGVEEIIKLAQAGLSETVLLLYVDKTEQPFDLDAAEIIYLNDIGIPSTVLAAMLSHDGKTEDVLHDALDTNNVQVATAPPPAPQSVSTQAPPQHIEVSSNYVATTQPGGNVFVTDPNAAQAPVVVQQEPIVVQQPVVVEQPAVTYSYFYSSLAPYGSWVLVSDYGWCWQPTIAVTHHGWRPYLHGGRWLSSDVGWYWHSDYSWGWAPFHYGRWYCAPRYGWVWTPGYTWGPSWVTWRRSSDYCGWAPLPPRCDVRPGFGFSYWGHDVGFSFSFGYSHDYYAWVPASRFCDRRLTDHVVHTERASHIYRDSTVVNNYIVGNNNTIVNNGIGRDFVRSHAGSELPRVHVAEASAAGRTVQPDRIRREGREMVVYRPPQPSPALVKRHEEAVTRSRNELARVSNGSAASRETLAAVERPQAITPGIRSSTAGGSRSRESAPLSRNEIARPQIAGRTPAPVFGTPAPVRPEPDRSAEILRSRRAQEVPMRQGTSPAVSTRSEIGSTVRPNRLENSVAPRFTPNPAASPVTGGSRSAETARPGVPTTLNNRVSPSPIWQRSRPAEPARSPDLVRPQTPIQRTPPVVSPSVSRPTVTPAAPSIQRSVPNSTPNSVPGARPNIQISPQAIQRSAPTYQAPTPAARPNVIQRNESFSRPSATPSFTPGPSPGFSGQAAPSVRVVRPPVSSPSISAPAAVRSAPASPGISSSTIRGGNFRSAPPASAGSPSVIRPSSPGLSRPSPSPGASTGGPATSSGRGRVEIGR